MNNPVFISICIPVYKHVEYLKRLLDSIASQNFRDFEIVITDDSKDRTVEYFLQSYKSILPIKYHKNEVSLGPPENWNAAIQLAKGTWIKIMHDDDWFSDESSLQTFAEEAKKGNPFIFSGYTNIFDSGKKEKKLFPSGWKRRLARSPLTLMAKNVIGPPSVTMLHHSIKERYDGAMKWRVDIDFYIRVISNEKTFSIIDQPLINVGISSSQVTNDCFNVPQVELPEALLMIKKYGLLPLRNLVVYDAWWRMLRNLQIRNKEELFRHTQNERWPQAIINIVEHESLINQRLLKMGIFSKFFMFISYLMNRKFLK